MRAVRACLLHAALLLGATAAEAQVRPDSVRRDSVRVAVPIPDRVRDSLRADSLRRAPATGARARAPELPLDSAPLAREQARRDSVAVARSADTIKAPIARFETPATFDLTDRLTFSRDEILSSGAVNMADLLDRVPGVTTFRTGWIAGVHTAAYQGDFGRIRLFMDGIELDAIQPREGGVLDLTEVPLWTLDELVIERAPGEVRVWMRSWSTERTTPYTRADIFTGDLNTNGFRALFARRYRNGFVLQFGGEQAATQTGRTSAFTTGGIRATNGDGSVQTVNVRVGWSRGLLSADAYATGSSRDRDPLQAREDFLNLAQFKGSRRDALFRVGYGDTARGFWTQAVVGVLRTRLEGIADTTSEAVPASTDTVAGRTQQMVTVGYRAARWQVSLLDRVRPIGGKGFHAPAARGSFGTDRYRVGGYAEQNGVDSTRRVDLFARVLPLPWLAVSAAIADRAPTSGNERPANRTMRAEVGVRFRDVWLGGGMIKSDRFAFDSPDIFGLPAVLLDAPASTGATFGVIGRIYKDLRLDVQGITWDTPQFGRPRTQVRTELALVSNWLRRFPKGQFGIDARIIHDVRERVPFYYSIPTEEDNGIRFAERMPLLTGQLQIRIQRASLFYQYRNLTGRAYEQIPGIVMPPAVQMYGVRWEFFN